MIRVGYLDLLGAIEHTVELAPAADALGYARYWLTEFPPQPSPIVLCGVIAGLTERIHVGTAAILFAFYPPMRTAHEFLLLERLYEGRIDAGLSSSTAAEALLRDDLEGRSIDALARAHPARFATFLRHLRNTPGSPAYDAQLAWPGAPEAPPPVWSLGAGRSAELAAAHGTGYGYPLMYRASVDDPGVARRYRDAFVPHTAGDTPRSVIAVAGYCAPTDAEARAAAAPWAIFAPHVTGSPATVAARLAELRDRYAADEVIWSDMTRDLAARHWSLAALADAAHREPSLLA
jgi:luciferase family oxidoreductase group 1